MISIEEYVYFSIIFFYSIIFLLYIYIGYEKIINSYKSKRLKRYSRRIIPYIDVIINRIMNGEGIREYVLDNIKHLAENKDKRQIIAVRLVYYLENFKGDFIPKIVRIGEYSGIVKYEIKVLEDNNNFKKALAAKWLGELRSRKAIPALLKQIETPSSDVKYNILLALAKIGEESSFIKAFEAINSAVILSERSLIEIVDSFQGDKISIYRQMLNSSNAFIASVFIRSAGNYKNMCLSHEISKYFVSEEKELRIAAVKAMGSIGDRRYLDDMIKLIEDDEWEVRAVTAKALSNFSRDEKILLPLAKALSDTQWYVRYNAAASILNHDEGMSVISYVFKGEDKFAKDIFISALENSPNNQLYLYENSGNARKVELAFQIRKYIEMRRQAA